MSSHEGEKSPKQDEECEHEKRRKDAPLHAARLPENIPITERPEPKQVNPIGHSGAATENDDGNYGNEKKQFTAAATRLRCQLWPINGIGQLSTPLFLLPNVCSFKKS